MKKMNNSGFAISSLLYGLLLVAFLVVAVLMSIMASNRKNTTELVEKIDDELSRHSNSATEFSYTGDVQEFIVPYGMSGWYKIELWGASANGSIGDTATNRGSYTSGTIYLKENEHLYFYIGAKGSSSGGAFNKINSSVTTGGGATDVRLVSGGTSYNDTVSKSSIIMLAGGGGNGGTYPGSTFKGSDTGASYIAGFNGQSSKTHDGVTYSFIAGKMFHAVNGASGKAKIDLVSRNPKTSPPTPVDKLSSSQASNYYISLASDPGRVLTAISTKAPARLLFYDGLKKQKWTINKVSTYYTIIENGDSHALQPEKTENTGYFEANTNAATLGKYTENIWEHWAVVAVTTDQYMIKPLYDQSYCLTADSLTQNALFKLKKCSSGNQLQIFKLYNANY